MRLALVLALLAATPTAAQSHRDFSTREGCNMEAAKLVMFASGARARVEAFEIALASAPPSAAEAARRVLDAARAESAATATFADSVLALCQLYE
jgi:hypothetical protein